MIYKNYAKERLIQQKEHMEGDLYLQYEITICLRFQTVSALKTSIDRMFFRA